MRSAIAIDTDTALAVGRQRRALVRTLTLAVPDEVLEVAQESLARLDDRVYDILGPCLLCGTVGRLYESNARHLSELLDPPRGICGVCANKRV